MPEWPANAGLRRSQSLLTAAISHLGMNAPLALASTDLPHVPMCAQALWCTPDRLGRWCGLDLGLVTRRLQEAWEEKGAWGDTADPTDTPADGVRYEHRTATQPT